MSKQSIVPKNAAPPVGPCSPAVQVGNTLYISGQIPILPNGDMVTGNIQDQTRQVLANISAILQAANLDWSHVVKVNMFTTDLAQFNTINAIYADVVSQPFPARAAIEVPALPKGANIEMEAIAYVK